MFSITHNMKEMFAGWKWKLRKVRKSEKRVKSLMKFVFQVCLRLLLLLMEKPFSGIFSNHFFLSQLSVKT